MASERPSPPSPAPAADGVAALGGPAVHHVGIVVDDLERAVEAFVRAFGVPWEAAPRYPGDRGKAAFLRFANCEIELVEPHRDDSPLAEWFRVHGPGLHHVALAMPDVKEAAARLERRGVGAADPTPRQGARRTLVVNLSPDALAGALIQIIEA